MAGSDAALSVDALRGRGRDAIPQWPLFLKVQVSIVYLFAGLSKLNAAFLSGEVLANSFRSDGPFAVPAGWRTTEPMVVLSLVTIATELFLSVGLLVPRLRPVVFVVGISRQHECNAGMEQGSRSSRSSAWRPTSCSSMLPYVAP
ncbi:MAG TPA: HTTM domain-containing protein [Candidatus Limnocylindrales bacterium]|nr:HTTM domain-containing protein [Candidatus Limnocylindrales bacterium]